MIRMRIVQILPIHVLFFIILSFLKLRDKGTLFYQNFLYVRWWFQNVLAHRTLKYKVLVSLMKFFCPVSNERRQCCGSDMFIQDPGSWFLSISDPGSKNRNKREGWKKICCFPFFGSHKNHKTDNYINFELMRKKIWANLQRIIELFNQKTFIKLSKIWVWDPGYEIRDPEKKLFRIPEPRSRDQKGTGSRIRIRNTERWTLWKSTRWQKR